MTVRKFVESELLNASSGLEDLISYLEGTDVPADLIEGLCNDVITFVTVDSLEQFLDCEMLRWEDISYGCVGERPSPAKKIYVYDDGCPILVFVPEFRYLAPYISVSDRTRP